MRYFVKVRLPGEQVFRLIAGVTKQLAVRTTRDPGQALTWGREDAEAIALIGELDLEGQQKFISTDEETGQQTRSPYRKMTKDEKFVYERLCPRKTDLKSYSDEPIPIRVLHVAVHAVQIYDTVEVWHPENADVKDPVLVGRIGSGYSDREYYILARWGEVLEPLSKLMKAACADYKDALLAELAEAEGRFKAYAEKVKACKETAIRKVGRFSCYETSAPS